MEERITQLEQRLQMLSADYYQNNFGSRQDFGKDCVFKTKLIVPHYSSDPTTCEVGEIIEVGGKLKICSAANTWAIIGTQTA